jgi:hypothetical protein
MTVHGNGNLNGQERGWYGLSAGQASSRQLWSGAFSTDRVSGVTVGAFADVQTPVSSLSVRAEVAYVRKGTTVQDEVSVEPGPSRVESDYLGFPVHVKATIRLGRLAGYVFGGPTIEQLLRTRCRSDACVALGEEKPTVMSVGVGCGIGLELTDGLRSEFEVRLTEGLSESYVGVAGGVRNRSVEFLGRLGLPL